MKQFFPLILLSLVLPAVSLAQDDPFAQNIRTTEPLTPEQELKSFTVPKGFRVTLFASEPQIQKPLNMAFDSRGRLWVSGTVDYPGVAKDYQGNDTIKILEDTNGDGRADKITTFAEKLSMPMGLYPYKNGVVAFCIPDIYYFEDTTGDGKADRRTKLYGPFDHTRDTHGLCNAFRRGYDGWVYACHGFNNHSTVKGKDGHEITMQSGNTFRFRLDGSRIEHYTKGQVNPFGMTFDKYGDLYNSDCHTKPLTLLLRGGCYESFGKPHDGLGFVPPIMQHSHGSTAIAGATQYTGHRFPQKYQESLFLGNVMTGRVHRDILKYTGSSVAAVQQEDFLATSDPWFRPVDLQCGPDGALYIADFYNRIIGHYEVPLNHPGRDRHRGRIWKVEYIGTETRPVKPQPTIDLATATVPELITAFEHPSLVYRMRAIDELTDRHGKAAVPELLLALKKRKPAQFQVHCMWALFRLGESAKLSLTEAFTHADELVRIHAYRMAAELPSDAPIEFQSIFLVLGLMDSSPLVRRVVAEVMGQHPDPESLVKPLTEFLQEADPKDVHLLHTLRMSLRNQLLALDGKVAFDFKPFTLEQASRLAEALLGVPAAKAAPLLSRLIQEKNLPDPLLSKVLTHAASDLSAQDVDRVVQVIRLRLKDDLDTQLSLLEAIREGLLQQGEQPTAGLQTWAISLAEELLNSVDPKAFHWQNRPGSAGGPNPWGLEKRSSADGVEWKPFLSSLPGGEQATGTLRSRSFAAPNELSFFICGHLGFPQDPPAQKNFIRLCLNKTGEEIKRVYAPRKDLAQQVKWDLKAYADQQVYLEIVDGLDLNAYAWLAVSRFEPKVVSIEYGGSWAKSKRLNAGAWLAGQYQLTNLTPQLKALLRTLQLDLSTRQAAAHAIASLRKDTIGQAFTPLISNPTISDRLREQLCVALTYPGNSSETLSNLIPELLKSLPANLQQEVATALVFSTEGATLFFQLLEKGLISPRLLQSNTIRVPLQASQLPDIEKLIAKHTAGLVPLKQEIQQLIVVRGREFRQATTSSAKGRALFEKNCMACHSLQNKGGKVGPQLDGIGNRGRDRLLEDLLDPNRNVDVAFHTKTYALENGTVVSGQLLRTEGETLVLANEKGKEVTIQKGDIDVEKQNKLSIMPENLAAGLPKQDFFDLLSYLLTQREQRVP